VNDKCADDSECQGEKLCHNGYCVEVSFLKNLECAARIQMEPVKEASATNTTCTWAWTTSRARINLPRTVNV
jgi:hypothetical protein